MESTTANEETPRPERKPTGSRENRWEIAGYGEPEFRLDSEDLCADAYEVPTGYEADEDPYWEQHAEG